MRSRESIKSANAYSTAGHKLDVDNLSLEMWYGCLNRGGLTPFVWSQACGHDVPNYLLSMDTAWLVDTVVFQTYQGFLWMWDDSFGGNWEFDYNAFKKMHAEFVKATDQLAHKVVDETAKAAGIGRNDSCFCGSGRKYKKCCARKSLDALVGLC